ncbi:MAG: phosphatidate cytidylyltransferase [bacterium]|nr:phosphatidate cytidylyltransferase [bacterium]
MQQRVYYGLLAIVALASVTLLDGVLAVAWPPDWPLGALVARGTFIPLLFAGLVLAAGFEMLRLMAAVGLRPHKLLALVMTVLLLVSPWLCAAGVLGNSPSDVEGVRWQLVWLVVLLVGSGVAYVARGVSEGSIADIGATWFMVLYLGLFPSFVVQLRSTCDLPGEPAAGLVLFFLLVSKASDVGGYLVGSTLGRHKLMPAVSPKKSIEGAIGGIAASCLVAVVMHGVYYYLSSFIGAVTPLMKGVDGMTAAYRDMELWQVIVFGALMSVSGQLGDLFESGLKRAARQKDSAQVLPGFGGVLDLIDSPIVAGPVAWLLLTVWWNVV